jgi:hypothetical protein
MRQEWQNKKFKKESTCQSATTVTNFKEHNKGNLLYGYVFIQDATEPSIAARWNKPSTKKYQILIG